MSKFLISLPGLVYTNLDTDPGEKHVFFLGGCLDFSIQAPVISHVAISFHLISFLFFFPLFLSYYFILFFVINEVELLLYINELWSGQQIPLADQSFSRCWDFFVLRSKPSLHGIWITPCRWAGTRIPEPRLPRSPYGTTARLRPSATRTYRGQGRTRGSSGPHAELGAHVMLFYCLWEQFIFVFHLYSWNVAMFL